MNFLKVNINWTSPNSPEENSLNVNCIHISKCTQQSWHPTQHPWLLTACPESPLRTGGPSLRPRPDVGVTRLGSGWDKIVREAGPGRADGTLGPVVRESRGCQGFYTHLGVCSKQQARWRETTLLRSRQEKVLVFPFPFLLPTPSSLPNSLFPSITPDRKSSPLSPLFLLFSSFFLLSLLSFFLQRPWYTVLIKFLCVRSNSTFCFLLLRKNEAI